MTAGNLAFKLSVSFPGCVDIVALALRTFIYMPQGVSLVTHSIYSQLFILFICCRGFCWFPWNWINIGIRWENIVARD